MLESVTPELREQIIRHIVSLGNVEAAKFYGVKPNVIGMWKKGIGQGPKLEHAKKFQDKDNPQPEAVPQGEPVVEEVDKAVDVAAEPTPSVSETEEYQGGKKLAICFPCYRQTNPLTMYCILSMFNKEKHHFILEHNSVIIEARNRLAKQFLATGVEWSFWLDDDMVPVIGNSPWWRKNVSCPKEISEEFSQLHVIPRLASHGQKMVSALYFGRNPEGRAIYAEGILDDTENRFAHKTPRNELRVTKGMGMGCALIHRDVFLAVREKHPELEPSKDTLPFPFFTPHGNEGEDLAFSIRARAAGFQPHVDLGCLAGHVGYNVWAAWNTKH